MNTLEPWSRRRDEATSGPLLALGTMNFGKRTPAKEAERIVRRALERGVSLFDTANAYGDGESERILGAALGARRDEVLVATKVGFGRRSGKPEGLAAARVLEAAEESLARLRTDRIDLYYLHVPDHATPVTETLSAVSALLDAQKIRAFGVSNYASWQILEIAAACDGRGMPRPIVSQVLYNLLIRQLDLEYARFVERHPIHTTVFNALAGGLLSGRHDPAAPAPKGSRFHDNRLYQGRYWSARFFELVEAHRRIAEEEGMTLVELAYAWLAGSPIVDSILVGAADVAQLDAAIDACGRRVSPSGQRKIDELHRAHLGTDASYAR